MPQHSEHGHDPPPARPTPEPPGQHPIIGWALILAGAAITSIGAGTLANSLTSPPHLATGIVQAGALVLLTFGIILLAPGTALVNRARHAGIAGTHGPISLSATVIAIGLLIGLLT